MGVPAVTAVHGFIHALHRNLNAHGCLNVNGSNVSFNRFAMIYESLTPNLSKHKYGYSTIGRRTPAVLSAKKGEDITSGSFNLNTRCNFKLHLMLELDDSFTNDLLGDIDYLLYRMKLAGGDIISHTTVDESCIVSNFNSEDINFLNCYVLLDRKDLMIERMENSDAVDALLDNLSKHHTSEKDDNDNVTWKNGYLNQGYFIPISIGFNGITELLQAKDQRDYSVEHRFAENVVTLGEFRKVHNFTSIEQMLWSYEHNNNKYIVTQ
jgi:CRISPR-associated protein Csy2